MHKVVALLAVALVACSQQEVATDAPAIPPGATAPPQAPQPAPQTAPEVEGPELRPVDEASMDPSLVEFRRLLLEAIRRRDRSMLEAAIHPNIRTSFGNGGGIAEFREKWSDDEIWQVLEAVLKNGGTWQKGSDVPRFWAPYVYSAWPDSEDAFESLAVIADNIPLRQAADPKSNVIGILRWDIVKRTGSQSPQSAAAPFTKVRTADGREGWVETKYLRSPIDYRAGLVKTDSWKIDALVAGD
jgi:hypothetical protein